MPSGKVNLGLNIPQQMVSNLACLSQCALRSEIVVNWIVYTSVYQKTEELIPRRVDPEKSKAFSPELRNASDGPD